MKNWTKALGILGIFILCSCSHGELEAKLDKKLSQESVDSRSELRAAANQTLENADDLTAEQKNKLILLRSSIRDQNDKLALQSVRLRAILVKDVLSNEEYDRREVELIKSRLKEIENKRLSLVFDAVDKANAILGRNAPKYSAVIERYTEYSQDRIK